MNLYPALTAPSDNVSVVIGNFATGRGTVATYLSACLAKANKTKAIIRHFGSEIRPEDIERHHTDLCAAYSINPDDLDIKHFADTKPYDISEFINNDRLNIFILDNSEVVDDGDYRELQGYVLEVSRYASLPNVVVIVVASDRTKYSPEAIPAYQNLFRHVGNVTVFNTSRDEDGIKVTFDKDGVQQTPYIFKQT